MLYQRHAGRHLHAAKNAAGVAAFTEPGFATMSRFAAPPPRRPSRHFHPHDFGIDVCAPRGRYRCSVPTTIPPPRSGGTPSRQPLPSSWCQWSRPFSGRASLYLVDSAPWRRFEPFPNYRRFAQPDPKAMSCLPSGISAHLRYQPRMQWAVAGRTDGVVNAVILNGVALSRFRAQKNDAAER